MAKKFTSGWSLYPKSITFCDREALCESLGFWGVFLGSKHPLDGNFI